MPSKSNNAGCLGVFLNWGKSFEQPQPPNLFPYAKQDNFLSAGELRFYHILKRLIPEGFTLITKVNLADLFYVPRPNVNKGARNRIDRKHVDFVICESTSMQPALAIELDDSSHNRKKRIERDAFVDQVFAAADLSLLHIKVVQSYDEAQLAENIRSHLGNG
ncbi:DUF2726 domain-containing protein [Roseibacillus persicicus]|uniref:DUF2726 domain-containing protein n=1 Tax=Roseibacillus persicicus TaxID=454148 RepID=A0A918WG49_9BACT|nr:DUF2726 domain-containing protein [Roseibacillus persicicus]GHC43491.1 hypothetical protein GCM10007100_05800 [Roseibacillus persicicus]